MRSRQPWTWRGAPGGACALALTVHALAEPDLAAASKGPTVIRTTTRGATSFATAEATPGAAKR